MSSGADGKRSVTRRAMAAQPFAARFIDTPISNESWKTAFSGEFEHERMSRVRHTIGEIRRQWQTNSQYQCLVDRIKRMCDRENLDGETKRQLGLLFQGFRDYGDVDSQRPLSPSREQFDAIDLYCSGNGYLYISEILQKIFRKENPSHDELVRATVFVEWITIDLYNLRLSQIGDCHYENFEGTVHRWMKLDPAHVPEYEDILRRSELAKRNFAIPLGFLSTSTDLEGSKKFASLLPVEIGRKIRVLHTVEVRGIDPQLLACYRDKYPDSVVTSICAMPVANMSNFDEKEVLLRWPFFHLIAMFDRTDEEGPFIEMISLSMQANRDHASELSSDEGEKARQRAMFVTTVNVSKWEACAHVAQKHAPQDVQGYRDLQKQMLHKLRQEFSITVDLKDQPRHSTSRQFGCWLGGLYQRSYPPHYVKKRRDWQTALSCADWEAALKVLDQEYSWSRGQWYNVGRLLDDDEPAKGESLTLLHELVRGAPLTEPTAELEDDSHRAWKELVREASGNDAWKTLRTFDAQRITAEELARERGLYLAERLKPKMLTRIDMALLASLEMQLHDLMKKKAATFIDEDAFNLPQLSVLTEMEHAELWIPIPRMYGGFLVIFEDSALKVTVFETQIGLHHPIQTTVVLR